MLANRLAALGHDVRLRVLQRSGPLQDALDDVELEFSHPLALPDARRADVIVSGFTNTEVAHASIQRWGGHGRGATRWVAASHSMPPDTGRLYSRSLRTLVRRADAVVALNDDHATALARIERIRERLVVIPNGTEMALRRPAISLGGPLRVGVIGRLEPVKGVDRLLPAMAALGRFEEWNLDVYGDGSQFDDLRETAVALGLPVTWHGWADDVRRALDSLHVLVLPSRSEAMPMAVLEAMARGVAVAAPPVGGLRTLLAAGRGIVLSEDPSAWPHTFAQLLNDREGLVRIAEEAQNRVSPMYTAEAMVTGYVRVFSQLLRGGGK